MAFNFLGFYEVDLAKSAFSDHFLVLKVFKGTFDKCASGKYCAALGSINFLLFFFKINVEF